MRETKYMDAWIQVPLCKKGDKLYHYTMADGVRGIIENREFMATKSDFLNDKLEFQYAVEVMGRLTEQYIVNQALRERFFAALKAEIDQLGIIAPSCTADGCCKMEEELSFYVVSFSKQPNNALLWAEFTDFCGYCMEFDYEKLVEGFPYPLFWHGTVIYEEQEQIAGLLESLLYFIHHLVEEGAQDLADFFEEETNPSEKSLQKLVELMAVACSVYAMFFKKNCFAGEEEYRFVFSPIQEGEESAPQFRLRDQIFLPYIMVEYQQGAHPLPVESVTVGAKNNSDIAVRGMRYFLRAQGIAVPVLLSDIPLRY